jgi:pimeloyl-ACP methyl ester carboxylesterase
MTTQRTTLVLEDGTALGAAPLMTASVGDVVAIDESDVRYCVKSVVEESDGNTITVAMDPLGQSGGSSSPLSFVSGDGATIFVHDLGGSGPPVLVCHATGFHGMAYAPFARALADRHKVWAIDFKGHGLSTAPESGDFAWPGMGEEVVQAVAMIGDGPMFAVGHSMGGAAILLAQRAHPEMFDAAYLYEPIVFPTNYEPNPREMTMSAAARARRAVFPDKDSVFERYGARPPLNDLRPDALAAYVEHGFHATEDGEVQLACLPEHEGATFDAPDKLSVPQLDGFSMSLAVAAGYSPGVSSPADMAPHVVDTVAGAVLDSHPELGHFGPLQAPSLIAERAAQFFAEGVVGNTAR